MNAGSSARTLAGAALLFAMALGTPALRGAQNFDLVVTSGRAVDPESGLDGVRDIGIVGRTISAISRDRLSGTKTIDATGLVVAPGFIDYTLSLHDALPI